jgi:uncharacterized protein (DUF305 family)
MMDKSLVNGLIGGLVGVALTLLITNYSVNNQNFGMMRMMGMGRGVERMMDEDECPVMGDKERPKEMGMGQMSSVLSKLRGDEFDREFIRLMIEHHKGAIDMAELVLTNSQRNELRQMADDIISAQSKEIEMMQKWNSQWFGE